MSMHNVLARKQSFQTECKMESVYMRNMFMFHPTGTLIPTYIILSFFPELRIRDQINQIRVKIDKIRALIALIRAQIDRIRAQGDKIRAHIDLIWGHIDLIRK